MKGNKRSVTHLKRLAALAVPCTLLAPMLHASPLALINSLAPQPAPSCVTTKFSSTTTPGWASETLTVTNTCATVIDFRDAAITFTNKAALNTTYWGTFTPMSYPINTNITSQPLPNGGFQATIPLIFDTASWVVTKLPAGRSFTIKYGEPAVNYDAATVKVFLGGAPISTGQIDLTNQTTKPNDVISRTVGINVSAGSQTTTVQIPWGGSVQLANLPTGTYSIQPQNVTGSAGMVYQGAAVPSSITLGANQKINSNINYTPISAYGSIQIQTPALPPVLGSYTGTPSITLTRTDTGATVSQSVNWNTLGKFTQLPDKISYTASTPTITFNGSRCAGSFSPNPVTSSSTTAPTSTLSYQCAPIAQDQITFNLSGLPASVSSMTVTLTPNDGSAPINQAITITNGAGNAIINLSDGVVYQVNTAGVSGYSVVYNPQPLIAKPNGTENITWTKQTGGRVITYVPGWKTPPSPTALAAAGYTHTMIAFGVFSTTTPGAIVSAFDTITPDYIKQLHAAGIKAILSLGGASSSIPATTVDFNAALKAASSPAAFKTAFINSINQFVQQYQFDGVDIDIEFGLDPAGTFTAPTGPIAVMADILKTIKASNPSFLITLTPQTLNVGANRIFSGQTTNYSALIMQLGALTEWVGIQLYNTGCMLGIDTVCYDPNAISSPNFSVALAVDVLMNWPAKLPSGQSTGFLPYVSPLSAQNVVLGYPAPNASGQADGAPVTPVATIKRAIQCLQTAQASSTSCGTYVPPKAFPGIGGVFNWEVTFDQANNYAFAKGLAPCVKTGVCQ